MGFVYSNNEREEEFDEMRDNKNTPVPVANQTFEINVASNIDLSGQPFHAFDPDTNALFLKAVPRNISKYDIYEYVGKLEGFQTISLSEPVKKLSFSRYCWITFIDNETLEKAEIAMNGLMIKGEPITIGRSISKNRRIKVLKNYPSSRIQNDSRVCEKLAFKLDE